MLRPRVFDHDEGGPAVDRATNVTADGRIANLVVREHERAENAGRLLVAVSERVPRLAGVCRLQARLNLQPSRWSYELDLGGVRLRCCREVGPGRAAIRRLENV